MQLTDVGNRYVCSLSTAMSFESRETNIDGIEQAVRSMRALASIHTQYVEGFVVEAIMNPSPDAVFTDSSFCHRSCLCRDHMNLWKEVTVVRSHIVASREIESTTSSS